ncbi:hypothetical protein SHIRM173S_08626 [Streptomyces hirsutus]
MLLWVVFGMPASNLALSLHSMPGFFQFLHGVLPLPAAGESLRSLLYFDDRGAGGYLIPLVVWIVVAFVLALLKERRSGTAIPAAPPVTDVSTPLPALAGGPVRSPKVRYFAAIAFPLAILVGVVGSMSASMHQPKVHDLPVVVVAADAGQAEQMAEGLKPQLGDMLDIRTGTSVDEVKDQILEQEVVGAYVLPTTADGGATLYSSSAAGASQQMALRAVFQQVAAGQEMPLELTDIKPLTSDDTMGSNSMYIGMSWIMAGFLIMAVLRGGAPELTRLRHFVVKLAGWAVGISVWLWFLFDVLIGAVNGHAFEMIGFGALRAGRVGACRGRPRGARGARGVRGGRAAVRARSAGLRHGCEGASAAARRSRRRRRAAAARGGLRGAASGAVHRGRGDAGAAVRGALGERGLVRAGRGGGRRAEHLRGVRPAAGVGARIPGRRA